MVAKSCPMNPSGVQLSRPVVPPGRQTRSSASAASWRCGANITPTQEEDGVELLVPERQRLGVSGAPREVQTLCLGRPAANLQQLGSEIGRGDLGATTYGGQRGVARARGDFEDPLPGGDRAGLDEHLAEVGNDL